MNYKIIKYICGCKYMLIPSVKHDPKCPEHNKTQKDITLWCVNCGSKVVAIPLAGHKRLVCYNCGVENQRKASRRWNAKHPNYFKVNTTDKYLTVKATETPEGKDVRVFNEWFQELRIGFEPVVFKEHYRSNIVRREV